MKKIIFALAFSVISLFAEVTTVVPFIGVMSYDKDSDKSIKDSTTFGGIYSSIGTLDYLAEFNYVYMGTTYKADEDLDDLVQHDITLTYAKYFKNIMFKIGAHYTTTNEEYLGNGIVAITSVGGYKFIGYDKFSYGVEGYYSFYNNRIDESVILEDTQLEAPSRASYGGGGSGSGGISSQDLVLMGIIQITPYFTYFKSINDKMSNSVSLKINYQIAENYIQSEYLSFELSDTFYYKNIFVAINTYGGEMKSGVKDGGITVYNSLDLQKTGYGVIFGYYFTKDLTASINYALDNYVEVGLTKDTQSSTLSANLTYKF